MDAAPLSALGGDLRQVLDHRQATLGACDDAKPIQMRRRHLPINEVPVASLGETRHHRAGQAAAAHGVKRRLIQDEVGMAGPKQRPSGADQTGVNRIMPRFAAVNTS